MTASSAPRLTARTARALHWRRRRLGKSASCRTRTRATNCSGRSWSVAAGLSSVPTRARARRRSLFRSRRQSHSSGGSSAGAAPAGEAKTTITFQTPRAVTEQREFLGWSGAGGRVLVIDAEQGLRTIKRRLREAGLDKSDRIDYVRVPDGLSLNSDAAQVAEVERLLAAGEYAVVIADPLYKLHTGDSNDERGAVDLMRVFDGWRERFRFAFILPAIEHP